MRRALRLNVSLSFLGIITASCLCLAAPAGAQDPHALFAGEKAAPAGALKKSSPAHAPAVHLAPTAHASSASHGKASTAEDKPPSSGSMIYHPGKIIHLAPVIHRGPAPGSGGGAHEGSLPMASSAAVNAYCTKLWQKINNNWQYADGKNHVTLGVDVDAGGNVGNMQPMSSPHNPDAELKAQQAVTMSSPLDALPAGLPNAHLTVTFDSTADPHGNANSSGHVKLEYHPGGSSSSSMPSSSESSSAPETHDAPPEKAATPEKAAPPAAAAPEKAAPAANPAHSGPAPTAAK